MKQLTALILLFFHLSLSAQSPQLIFHSGFEPEVDTSGHNTGFIDIIGEDTSMPTPNDWVNDLDGHPNIGSFIIQFQGGDETQRMAHVAPDPQNPSNNAFKFWVLQPNSGNNGRIQANLYNNTELYKVFYSVRMYLPEVFNLLKTMPTSIDDDFNTLIEFWNNNNWDEDYPFRVKVNLTKNGNFLDSVRVKATGQYHAGSPDSWQDVWLIHNTSYVVPVKKWMTLRVYFAEGDDCTGRFIMTITPDGGQETIVFNVRNYTRHSDDPFPDGVRDFNPFKLYTSDDVVDWVRNNGDTLNIFWDDFEIWKDSILITAEDCLSGGIVLSGQNDIDNFPSNYPGCTNIGGNVTITGSVSNLAGLEQVNTIQGSLSIQNCHSLIHLDGLENLRCINGMLKIDTNNSLADLSALQGLQSVYGNLEINNNNGLSSLDGLQNLYRIKGTLNIVNNDNLSDITGIEGIEASTITSLIITNNSSLEFCETENVCKYIENGGPITIASNATGCNSVPEVEAACFLVLPVELTRFSGKENSGTVLLSWQTASEVDNDYFQVEYSTNGREFMPIGKINGHGTSTITNDYLFVHKQPEPGLNYYRLKQVDFGGDFTFSNIVAVAVENNEIIIRPNPTNGIVEISGGDLTDAVIKLFDSMGRLIDVFEATDFQTIDLSEQPRGVYIFVIQTFGYTQIERIVKN